MEKIKVAYFKAGSYGWPSLIEIDKDNLKFVDKLLNCSNREAFKYSFSGTNLIVFSDADAPLDKSSIPSAFFWTHGKVSPEPALFGNLIICGVKKVNDEEVVCSLTSDDISYLDVSLLYRFKLDKDVDYFYRAFLIEKYK